MNNRIERIRDALAWISASNPRIAEFGRYCVIDGRRPRKFDTDMPVRWNSTYLMLQNAIEYRDTISLFYNSKKGKGTTLLDNNDWYVAQKYLEFMKVFYNATVKLSGVYYPTSPLVIHHIVQMTHLFKTHRDDEL